MGFNAGICLVALLILVFTHQSLLLASLQIAPAPKDLERQEPWIIFDFIISSLTLSLIVGISHIPAYGWRSAAVIIPIAIPVLPFLVLASILASILNRLPYIYRKLFDRGKCSHLTLFALRAFLARAAPAIVVLYLRK
jgi:uncharacterized membrane protein